MEDKKNNAKFRHSSCCLMTPGEEVAGEQEPVTYMESLADVFLRTLHTALPVSIELE